MLSSPDAVNAVVYSRPLASAYIVNVIRYR